MIAGGVVLGSVRVADGVGVSGGTVWLVALEGDDADDRSDLSYPNNAGRYGIRVPAGRYRLEYRPEEGDPIVARELTLTEGARETIDFDLAR